MLCPESRKPGYQDVLRHLFDWTRVRETWLPHERELDEGQEPTAPDSLEARVFLKPGF